MAEGIEVETGGLAEAAARILAPPGGRRARRAAVRGFLAYLDQSPCRHGCYRSADGQAFLLTLLVPGGTAVLMLSDPGTAPGAHERLLHWWLAAQPAGRFHYLQSLLDPAWEARARLVESAGFRRLTRLVYLERSASYPWVETADPPKVAWVTQAEVGDGPFAATLPETYIESGDCPELTGLRPIESVLASHKAAGPFEGSLWHLLKVEGELAGCLLLSRLPQGTGLEVVYMGLVPRFRGQGWGRALLTRAVLACQVRNLPQLTLVVDARNTAAQRLYRGFGFQPTAERDAYLRFDA